MSSGQVHDIRFTRFEGDLDGESAAIFALARWSALRSMGARRSWKVKLIPIALTIAAFAPAVVVLGLRALFAKQISTDLSTILPYKGYAGMIGIIILLFAAVTTPELLCPDRRDRVLTLYFSTALTRGQYVFGKALAAIVPLLFVTLAPVAFLYAGNVLFADHPVGYVQDHLGDIYRIVVGGFIVASYYGLVGLAIASLTSRRVFAIGGYLAFTTVPTVVGGVLGSATNHLGFGLLAFAAVPIEVATSLYPGYTSNVSGPGGWATDLVVVMAISLGIIIWRYRGETG